jgi:hypothetical protein
MVYMSTQDMQYRWHPAAINHVIRVPWRCDRTQDGFCTNLLACQSRGLQRVKEVPGFLIHIYVCFYQLFVWV